MSDKPAAEPLSAEDYARGEKTAAAWVDECTGMGMTTDERNLARCYAALRQRLADQESAIRHMNRAYRYFERLFETVAPECKPLPDLIGLGTQIDNYIAGLRQRLAEAESAIANHQCITLREPWEESDG